MEIHECNLNIRYDLPQGTWNKVSEVYEQMPGWLGYGDGENGESGIPYWFNYNTDEKSVLASVEPSGLQFIANMETEEWQEWKALIKQIASKTLGFKVGEIEEGEVDG